MKLKKSIAKLLVSAMITTLPVFAAVPSHADANLLSTVLNVGIAGYQMSQVNKEIDKINNTEEGRQSLFNDMKSKQGVNNDPTLNNRLDGIMTNLHNAIAVSDSSINEKPFLYFINPQNDFNAACSLGHVMTVNTGIFELLRTDDEVAVVLGHEMAHGQKDHVVKGFKKQIPVVLAATAIASNTNTLGTVVTGLVVDYTTKVKITKPMEWEADNYAFDYISDSSYNLGACAAVWQRVIDKYSSQQDRMSGDIFSVSDHPSHDERLKNYIEKLKKYSNDAIDVKDSTVYIYDKEFISPAAAGEMTNKIRSYYLAGNLARAFHNGETEVSVNYGTVYMGNQPIITPTADDESADAIAEKLNTLKVKPVTKE
ncbi:MAG: M48 family metallopeptidase [Anaerovibrio sp.]|uniref:M48 family metallopeptidase n=1 Tax=Anaerovibrio sp. TaxID=1872532 RepID=UPI0025F0B19F|nr:M48 family metallopeptidase [Anaerovibrio sp.]MCR5176792.1 M48 family metallopeptidase [Anaerovibrio sp.]